MTNPLRQKAEDLVNKLNSQKDQCTQNICTEHGTDAIYALLETLRRETIEACAKEVLKETKRQSVSENNPWAYGWATAISEAIRKLGEGKV